MSPRHDVAFGPALLALTGAVGLTGASPESRTTWIHVAPFGEWDGHTAGKFSLTADHFGAVCAQVRAKRTPVSLDYEHASIRANGEPTPAAGFVLATEIRDDGLWALCEFTQRAADMIKAGEYRFCSGVFDFAARDQVSGEEMLCALDTIALTNRPFIDGQHPIALSRRVPLSNGAGMNKIQIAELTKLLKNIGDGVEMTPDQIKAAVDLLSAKGGEADAAAASEPPPADKADASAKPGKPVALNADAPAPAVALGDMPPAPAAAMAGEMPEVPVEDADQDEAVDEFDAKLMADLGISDADEFAAKLMANYDAIKAVLMGVADAGSVAMSRDLVVKGLVSQVEAVTKERNALLSEKAEAQAVACAAEVDALIRRSPALATERDSMIALAKTSPKEFRRVASVLAPTTAPLTQAHAVALSQPTAQVATKVIADDHPRIIEQRRSLSAAGIKGDAAERVIANVRKQLEIAG